MPVEITKNQAAELYLAELQREMAGLSPVDRMIKRYAVKVGTRTVFLSIVEMIAEVQNRTQIGLKRAVEYTQQLKDSKDEQLYLVI